MQNPLKALVKKIDTGLIWIAKSTPEPVKKGLTHLEEKWCNPQALPSFRVKANTAAFISLALGQTAAIKLNSKTPEDKKDYLVPQSIAEGAIYGLSVFFMGTGLKKLFSNQFIKGKYIPFGCEEIIGKNKDKLGEIVKAEKFTPEIGKFINKAGFDKIRNVHNGIQTFAVALIALPAAVNIAAPFFTNGFSKWYNRRFLGRDCRKCNNTAYTEAPPRNLYLPATKIGNKEPLGITNSTNVSKLYSNFNTMLAPKGGLSI